MKKLHVIIMAAGSGARLKSETPKAFYPINKKPLLYYSLAAFNRVDFIESIYIVIAPGMKKYATKVMGKSVKKIAKFAGYIKGGKERQDSVQNALRYLSNHDSCEYLAIHDAARPFITKKVITETWKACLEFGAAAPGIPVVDTIKSCNDAMIIDTHLKRRELIAIQTPQIFNFDQLYKAYEKISRESIIVTDDTEAFDLLYNGVKITGGDENLFKITYKDDIKKAKLYIKEHKKLWK